MTTASLAPGSRPAASRSRDGLSLRISGRPAEGWLTVLATVAMVVVLGASLIEAGWTPGWAGDSGFLLYLGPLGFAFGFLGAKVGWGRWRTHLVGALFAGLVIPLVTGGQVLAVRGIEAGWDPVGLAQRMGVAWSIFYRVWSDFAVLHLPFTGEASHYHMIFGTIVWGAGQLAAFTVFGHRRPLDAVVVVGLALLANLTVTPHDQLLFLIAFSAAALLLLIRTHVFEEEITWARRKIGDPASVGGIYLKGGAAFVTAAVLGSIVLTYTASSAPLQGLWQDLPKHLQGLSQLLQAIAPPGGAFRPSGGPTFGSSVVSSGQWNPSSLVAFRAQLEPGEDAVFKWRAGTFSQFNTYGWSWGATADTAAAAGADLLAGTADEPTAVGRRQLSIRVFPEAYRDQTIVAPNTIISVDRATVTRTIGTQGWFTTVESGEQVGPYDVSALIPVREDIPGGLTEARLRTAGFAYPDEIRTLYLQLPQNALGPEAAALLQTIRSQVRVPQGFDAANPYDLARTMEEYLSDSLNFSYDPDIKAERDQTCGAVSMAECFAILKRGYCEYYATAMAVMLRQSDVPARIAYGFLHGVRDEQSNVEEVGGWLAHWWVEVYFPGVGWVEFDPTGTVGQPAPLPSGSIGPSTPRPSLAFPSRSPRASSASGPTGPTNGPNSTGVGPFIAIALILIVGMGALAVAAVRRTPRRPMHPDQAWGSLARLASRFGLGPRPSQTVYEYAGALGDEVPTARVELTTLARAKVEVAYGRRDMESDRLQRIALAYHRLRLAILGLVVRRTLRRNRR